MNDRALVGREGERFFLKLGSSSCIWWLMSAGDASEWQEQEVGWLEAQEVGLVKGSGAGGDPGSSHDEGKLGLCCFGFILAWDSAKTALAWMSTCLWDHFAQWTEVLSATHAWPSLPSHPAVAVAARTINENAVCFCPLLLLTILLLWLMLLVCCWCCSLLRSGDTSVWSYWFNTFTPQYQGLPSIGTLESIYNKQQFTKVREGGAVPQHAQQVT
jgi:hypothetical protein